MEDIDDDARIMELELAQQMALQRLDQVVENQRNLRDNIRAANNNGGADRGGGEQGREPEQQPNQDGQIQPQQQGRNPHRRRRESMNDAGGQFCSITQLYFILSAILAFLAVVTSPSNILFASVRVSVKSAASVGDQPQQGGVNAIMSQQTGSSSKLEEGTATLDSNGNLVEKVSKKGEWEAVVAHTKAKRTSLAETAKETSEPSRHHGSSWTGMLTNFAAEIKEHFHQQYLVLQELARSSPAPESPQASAAATAQVDAKETSSTTRWLPPWEFIKNRRNTTIPDKHDDSIKETNPKDKASKDYRRFGNVSGIKLHSYFSPVLRVIDPSLIPSPSSKEEGEVTDQSSTSASQAQHLDIEAKPPTVVNKIFSSTPRLIAIANLLLAVTYLLLTAVASLFLGPVTTSNSSGGNRNNNGNPTGGATPFVDGATRRRRAGRERFGGFLLFKVLLVSAVLDPSSLDLFILLVWYTYLSFLRTLSHIAGHTASHASQSGERPSRGALRLLMLVLVCDVSAAIGCVALLRSTGLNMILLLTSDCVLLGVDAAAHIVRYFEATMEEDHRVESSHLEERQLELYAQRRELRVDSDDERDSSRSLEMEDERDEFAREHTSDLHAEERMSSSDDNGDALEDELRQLDQAVHIGDTAHQERMASMETTIFSLEVSALLVTTAHFLHIWALHGTSFGLVDGVLALHLHSTISAVGKKIAERRNAHRIAQELNSNFPDASDIDIRKASAAGDVCCICLNSMLIGSVKKVGCGHLMHSSCLREVVERERSFSAAKCPLCRASLVTGRQEQQVARPALGNNQTNIANNNDGAVGARADEMQGQPPQPAGLQLGPGEQSLLRFSTENILPAWVPVPAFAFEVVRRETPVVEPNPNPGGGGGGGWQRFFRRGGQEVEDTNNNDGNVRDENNEQAQEQGEQEQEQQRDTSFWRRLLILMGAIPMSPEEEAAALENLVEMFPQYDRADLLRELRARRSAEAVAESILLGIFSGVARGRVD